MAGAGGRVSCGVGPPPIVEGVRGVRGLAALVQLGRHARPPGLVVAVVAKVVAVVAAVARLVVLGDDAQRARHLRQPRQHLLLDQREGRRDQHQPQQQVGDAGRHLGQTSRRKC